MIKSKFNVVFNEVDHTYMLGDKQLSGITSRLAESRLFKDKYKNVPSRILNAKREYGSNVHKQIEMYDTGNPYLPIKEVIEYAKLKEKHQITNVANELLISDGEAYATMIDMVDSDINLYDHKTTYSLDKEYLSWQLSMCAYLLEKCTGVKANKLYAIHFKDGVPKRIEISRKSDEDIYDMFYTNKYISDEMPVCVDFISESEVQKVYNLESRLLALSSTIKKLELEKNTLLNGIGAAMETHGIDKVDIGNVSIYFSKPYERESIDSKAFKEDHPELAASYIRKSTVKGSIKVKIKNGD